MSVSYTPKTVLITGATGDFGKAFATRFADIGCNLIIHGRNADKVKSLCDLLDVPTHPLVFDISNGDEMVEAMANIPDEFKPIDVLINNAGLALGRGKAYEADFDDWNTMIDVNVKALTHMTNLVLKDMAPEKKGHIINIGSVAGNWPYPGGHVYCATKAFVQQFSLALRADLYDTGIRVTNIEPGMVETQFSLVRFKGNQGEANAVYADTKPLKPEDIAESVFWAATLPPHVNINTLEIMPTAQAFSPLSVHRSNK